MFSAVAIKSEQIQTAQTDKVINNAGKNAHIAKEERNKIELKKSNQSPVDGTDDDDRQCGTV